MRRFLVIGHTQKTDKPIPLNDAAGAGRWDVLARAVAAALLTSNGIRKDVDLYIVLRAASRPLTIRFRGDTVRNLNPDERAILGLLAKALTAEPVGEHEAEVAPGITAARWDLATTLTKLGGVPLVLLHEDGSLLESKDQAQALKDAAFVLSDHQEFGKEEMQFLAGKASSRICLGPVSLHTSSCIVIVHNWLDRA